MLALLSLFYRWQAEASGHTGLPGFKAQFLHILQPQQWTQKYIVITTFYLGPIRCQTLFCIIPNPHKDTVKFLFLISCVIAEETKNKKGLEFPRLSLITLNPFILSIFALFHSKLILLSICLTMDQIPLFPVFTVLWIVIPPLKDEISFCPLMSKVGWLALASWT